MTQRIKTVKDLIRHLATFNPDHEVRMYEPRSKRDVPIFKSQFQVDRVADSDRTFVAVVVLPAEKPG